MASRFWVGGTGTWDSSTTTNWAASTGGGGGQSVPGSGDTVTFDGNSGGGTVTVNTTVTISSLAMGAFTGTLDFSANNNNVNIGTVTPAVTALNYSGTGTRTFNMGNGTWTLDCTSAGTLISGTNLTNMTFAAGSSTIVCASHANVNRTINSGVTFNNLTMNAAASSGLTLNGTPTFSGTVVLNGQCVLNLSTGATIGTLSVSSSASDPVLFKTNAQGTQQTITLTNSFSGSYCAFIDTKFSGGTNTASNSFDLGNNSGITITGPSGGGGSSQMLYENRMGGNLG